MRFFFPPPGGPGSLGGGGLGVAAWIGPAAGVSGPLEPGCGGGGGTDSWGSTGVMLLAIVANAAVENCDCVCTAVARIALNMSVLFFCLCTLFWPWKVLSFISASGVSSGLFVDEASESSDMVTGHA